MRLARTATKCSEMSAVELREMQPSIHATGIGVVVLVVTSAVVVLSSPVVSVSLSGLESPLEISTDTSKTPVNASSRPKFY